MSVMELAEVVTPHFAVPVVGVVICAVLVFAFGFKSSVQPPSFDFERDEKHRLRQKTHRKPKKPQSNGHVVTVETPVTTVSKQTSPKPASSPKATSVEKQEGSLKTKVKKTPTTPKAKPEVPTGIKVNKEEDSGEWMTAKTRKRKPKKDDTKKDDGWDSAPEVVKVESTPEMDPAPKPDVTPETSVEAKPTPEVVVAPVAEAPLEKRVPKKDRKKKETPEKTPAVATEPAAIEATPVTPEPEKKAVSKPEVKPATASVPEPKVEEEKSKPSPKKKSKKKAKSVSPEAPPVKEPTVCDVEVAAEFTEVVVPEAAVVEVKDPIQEALEAAAADDDTLERPVAKSPKKNKKSKESRDKYQESLASAKLALEALAVEAEAVADATSSLATAGEPIISSTTEGLTARLNPASPVEDVAVLSSLSPDSAPAAQPDSSKVSFDELGDWQEAKPVKKRRKARREN